MSNNSELVKITSLRQSELFYCAGFAVDDENFLYSFEGNSDNEDEVFVYKVAKYVNLKLIGVSIDDYIPKWIRCEKACVCCGGPEILNANLFVYKLNILNH